MNRRTHSLPKNGRMPPMPPADPVSPGQPAPLVSIVIPSFNYGRFLRQAVDSALAQTFIDLEVIVVEGGSTDTTSREVARSLDHPRVQVLFQDRPTRVGANRNLGIAAARGRYICCLDADDTLKPTYIEKAVFLLERRGYDVVSSAMEFFGNQSGIISILARPHLSQILQGNHVLTTAVFRRSLWESAGGFRDVAGDKHIHEDWLFWARLGAYGARFANMADDPLMNYRVHGPSLSNGDAVASTAEQAVRVYELNADLIDQDTLTRSHRLVGVVRRTSATIRPEAFARPQEVAAKPTVLLAAPWLVLGGAERLLSGIVGHLTAQGWRVIIVTSMRAEPNQGDTNPWFLRHTPEIYHLPRFLPEDAWQDFLHHLVASRRVDLLWIVGSAFAYDRLPVLKATFPALKVVDLLFNTVGHTANNRRRRNMIDLNLAENKEVRDWLLARGEDVDRVQVIASGVDLEALKPLAERPARRELDAADDELLIGFAGRWSEEKNPLAFVEIARRVDPELPVRFVMTGTGPMRRALEEAIAKSGLPPGRLRIVGEVEDIHAWLGSLDLLVLPSKLDGRPVVVLEALALGTPVLASRVGALPELIEEGRTGWLCASEDIDGFVSRIEAWAASGTEAQRAHRRAARAFAEANLDSRKMLLGYESALAAVIFENAKYS
jgi:glycosyltransferase involved in cell wall biosynthesis